MNESWEQQPNESLKAYSAFQIYKNQGYRRSHKKVGIALGTKHSAHISAWSTKFSWLQRIKDWEKEQLRLDAEANREKYKEMVTKHYEQASALRNMLKIPFQGFASRLKSVDGKSRAIEDFENMTTKELFDTLLDTVRSLDILIKLERISLGAPTEIVNNTKEFENVSPNLYADKIANTEEGSAIFADLLNTLSNSQNG